MNETTPGKIKTKYGLALAVCPSVLMQWLLTATLCLVMSAAQAQGWQQHLSFGNYDFARGMLPTPDGGYMAAGHFGPGPAELDGFLVKLDPFGNEQWRKAFGSANADFIEDIEVTPDGGYVLCGSTFNPANGSFDAWLLKATQLGEISWSKSLGTSDYEYARSVIVTSDGGFALVGRSDAGSDAGILLIKTDAAGNEEWSNIYGGAAEDEAWGIAETADHQLVIAGVSSSFGNGSQDVYLAQVSLDGTFQWFQTFGGADDDFAFSIIPTSDGGLLAGGTTRSSGAGDYDVYLIKTTNNGTLEWVQTYGGAFGEWGAFVLEIPAGGYAVAGATQSFNNQLDDVYLLRTDDQGNLLWQRSYGQERKDIPHSLTLTPEGGFLLSAHSRVDTNGVVESSQGYLLRTGPDGLVLTNYLQGRIFFDEDFDCLPTPGETGFGGWHLRATGNNGTFYGITDADGYYSILTDTGTYVLRLVAPNNYWQPCENDLSLSFQDLYDTLVTDFPLQVAFSCPQLEVDIATGTVQPCASRVYQVRYCNHGTAPAENIRVDVTLDPAMTFISAGLTPSAQSGQIYSFEPGNLAPGECGGFYLETFLACDAEPGRTYCLTAEITPDSICLPTDPQWDGSSIKVNAACEVDSVVFTIKNTGTGDMAGPLYSIIVEDQIVGRAERYQLSSGDSVQIKHPAAGKTLRMEAPQSAGHPGRSHPSVAVEACGGSPGSVSLGYVTMFPEDDADAFRSVDCRENSGWLPPNSKQAFPKGIGNQHFIEQETDIEYLVFFKNTGEDTVATVVIQDTLSPWLDVTSLRPGAASHPYSLAVSNTGALQFTFENIHLPDSLTNDSASAGFVKFRVSQMPGVPFDSLIVNRSSVSFDFGAPVAKPQYFHTVKKSEVISISDVSLCTGGFYQGVAYQSDTTFYQTFILPATDSLFFTNIDVGDFGVRVEIDTFVWLGQPLNGWLLEADTTIVESFDIGMGCDSVVVWTVDVLVSTGGPLSAVTGRVFPNPASDHFFFETNPLNHGLQFELLNTAGQQFPLPPPVFSRSKDHTTWQFSTQTFPPGLYFFIVKNAEETAVFKIVKR